MKAAGSTMGVVFVRCLVVVSFLGTLGGCLAPPATVEYANSYAAANLLERENHPLEAAQGYGEAAALASRPRTRWQAAYRQARQLEVAGQREAALQAYLQIAEEDPEGEMASRCLYYAGRMAFEDGDLETGLARMRRVIEEYHDQGLAPQAVRRAVQQLDEQQGVEAAIEFLRVEEEQVRGTDVGDSILYRWAQLEKDRDGWEAALQLYEQMVELYPYPHSALYDDAMYEAGELALEHGQPQRALTYLEALVSWREGSVATGSYYTAWTDDAQLLIGRIHLEQLGDPDAAAMAFEELATFPDSILADDGLWWASRARLESGDHRRSCRNLRSLLEDFPASNQMRRAQQAVDEQGC